ncbi:glucuronide transporter [Arthrobacter tumbae]|uniref:glycoside-pentoside-hexuronide (GPH):cation symporter n=1 Tax=Arthrobacter tumbae TaxID=163874 RepID=UPI00195664C1|nr:glycoside-pentoside-hexuronide (GPH):cation symporter [Arthrobacter tumbae]MBM7781277.1 glucuronide carrier protein [Arthrobacter tumbae]
MTKRPPSTRLPFLSVASYGAGDIANSMTFTTVGMFLLVYYTDVAGIPAAAAGTLLLLAGLFNAVADIFAGRIADRNHDRRLGKFRPFLLFGAAPLGLSVVMFHIHNLDSAWTLTFAYVSYFAYCLAYSLVNVPYGALAGTLTRDPGDRARLASARTMGGLATTAFLGILIAPQFQNGADIRNVLTPLTVAFALVGTLLYLFTALATREQLPASAPRLSLRDARNTLVQNVPLQILCLSSLFFMTANVVTNTAKLFYLRDVLGRLELFALLSGAQVVITLVLALVTPRLVQRWGKRCIYISGGLLGAAGGVVVFVVPVELVWLAVAGMFLSVSGAAAVSILMWALVADTVEYGEWKTGHRTDGTNYSLLASTRKIGMALGGGLAAFALAWGGYVSGATEQSATAELGIRVAAGLAPAVILLLAVGVMRWYPLTDDAHAKLVLTIQERS